MTFKSLINMGDSGKFSSSGADAYNNPPGWYPNMGSHGHRGWKGGNSKGGGGGSSTALSALALLAFLFLINVMQQSLQEKNMTTMAPMMTNAVVFKNDERSVPVSHRSSEDNSEKKNTRIIWNTNQLNINKSSVIKSDPPN